MGDSKGSWLNVDLHGPNEAVRGESVQELEAIVKWRDDSHLENYKFEQPETVGGPRDL